MRRFIGLRGVLAVAAGFVLAAAPALAQQSYPTPASGVRVPGTVPLQCDSNNANCAPVNGNNPQVVSPAVPATYWTYAAASGGIVNTATAVTIKAAAGAGVRNYLCQINVSHDALGAASELAVRDGASGTVIWRMKLQTTALEQSSSLTFSPCLRGTANTLMEVVTLTATVSGGTYVNATGFTGN